MPNVDVTYAEMQAAASQLQAGEHQVQADLTRLKLLVEQLIAGGYVTDSSSKQFAVSYAHFHAGATRMIEGLNGMGQYLDNAARAFQDSSCVPSGSRDDRDLWNQRVLRVRAIRQVA